MARLRRGESPEVLGAATPTQGRKGAKVYPPSSVSWCIQVTYGKWKGRWWTPWGPRACPLQPPPPDRIDLHLSLCYTQTLPQSNNLSVTLLR